MGHGTSGSTTDNAMTCSEEELRVGDKRVEAGCPRLRAYVTTEAETRTVPVVENTLHVELSRSRTPTCRAPCPAPATRQEAHEVVPIDRRPVVQREAVPVERVRLDEDVVTETSS